LRVLNGLYRQKSHKRSEVGSGDAFINPDAVVVLSGNVTLANSAVAERQSQKIIVTARQNCEFKGLLSHFSYTFLRPRKMF
jgi:hypothetical protein